MTEQWQELKETIIELRDNDGTATQQEVCKFLANLMDVLEKQMQEPCDDENIKVPKKALRYRTAGMVAYNVEWLKNHFDIERAVICGAQEPKTGQFAEWVAREIFDDMWEYNKDAFAEIACRKLEKLGIVRAKGNEWELIEPQEGIV